MTSSKNPNTVSLNLSSENPTKADELDTLSRIKAAIPQTWYLSSLFSDDLIDYVTRQINGDMMPDLMAAYGRATDNRDILDEQLDQVRRDFTGYQNMAASTIEDLKGQVTKLNADLTAEHETLSRSVDSLQQQLGIAHRDRQVEADEHKAIIQEQADLILTLKAELYDRIKEVEALKAASVAEISEVRVKYLD